MVQQNVTVLLNVTLPPVPPTRFFRTRFNGEQVTFPITAELWARYVEQYLNNSGTPKQRGRKATVDQLVAAAYEAGRQDASRPN